MYTYVIPIIKARLQKRYVIHFVLLAVRSLVYSGSGNTPTSDKRLNHQYVLLVTTARQNFLDAILSDPTSNKGFTLAKSLVIPFLLGAHLPLWITSPESFLSTLSP
jgi:hypothetical protein